MRLALGHSCLPFATTVATSGQCPETTGRASVPLNTFLKVMEPRIDNAIATSQVEQGICVNSPIPIWNHTLHRVWQRESIPFLSSWILGGRAA